MLTIRKEQFAALSADLELRFERRVIAYLKQHFPSRCGASTGEALQSNVRHCIQRARQWDILGQSDICKYAILGLFLGPRFDTELTWANDILAQVSRKGVRWCLEELKAKGMDSPKGSQA